MASAWWYRACITYPSNSRSCLYRIIWCRWLSPESSLPFLEGRWSSWGPGPGREGHGGCCKGHECSEGRHGHWLCSRCHRSSGDLGPMAHTDTRSMIHRISFNSSIFQTVFIYFAGFFILTVIFGLALLRLNTLVNFVCLLNWLHDMSELRHETFRPRISLHYIER